MNTDTTTPHQPSQAAPTTSLPKTPLRFLWSTTKLFWPLLLLGILCNVIVQLLNTYTAVYIGQFSDAARSISEAEQFALWAGYFIALLAATFLFFRLTGFVAIALVLKQHTYAFLRVKEHLFQHSHSYFINRFAGTLSGKVFHAGDRSSELLLMGYYGFTRLVVGLLSTGFVIGFYSLWLAGFYFVILFITLGVNFYLVQRRRPHVVAYATATSRYRGLITDVVTNMQAVRQYANLPFESAWLKEGLQDRVEKDRVQWRMAEWNHVINNLLSLVLLGSMVIGMYILLGKGLVTIGAMVTVMILMYRVSGIIIDLGDWMNRVIRVYGEVEEGLAEILVPHEIVDKADAKELVATRGEIVWDKVDFRFDANGVFDDFSLTIEAGQRIGLVGPSGAGKTTFVSLLLRQHELLGGSIKIDGQDISTVTQDSLRDAIAMVPQEPALFHRTIRENIAYGKPGASLEEIEAVAKKAEAHEFITALPEGYDTLVGERGVKLSGGQKQRVAIARAMLKDAPLLILDEATSALDSESEVAIQKALRVLMEGKTVIAVAHRLSTLREMDRILVLENGMIVEDGPHAVLAKQGGTYQRLWEHQAGGFVGE